MLMGAGHLRSPFPGLPPPPMVRQAVNSIRATVTMCQALPLCLLPTPPTTGLLARRPSAHEWGSWHEITKLVSERCKPRTGGAKALLTPS